MFKTYSQARTYLESFIPNPKYAHEPMQLDRVRYLCQLLGNPQNNFPIIHVGGTSGKGSTATFAATILEALGLKTGLHLSPHLQLLTERVQINNQAISLSDFVTLVNDMRPYIDQVVHKTAMGPPTYFEILVAMTFYYFAKAKVDAAVIEVGLGGLYDATNIISPATVILTNVSLDHTKLLGKHVTKILKEKMGIIKPHAPGVVSGITQQRLQTMLIKKAHQTAVPLFLLGRDFALDPQTITLPGEFQRANFSLAAQACTIFVNKYFPEKVALLPQAIAKGAKTAFIPGRFEIVNHQPLVILDGAHNHAKMKALVTSLKRYYPKQKWLAVMAAKNDKHHKTMLHELDQITRKYFFTTFNQTTDMGKSLTHAPQQLAAATKVDAEVIPNTEQAMQEALTEAQAKKLPVIITGSLYLVGQVRNHWFPIKQ